MVCAGELKDALPTDENKIIELSYKGVSVARINRVCGEYGLRTFMGGTKLYVVFDDICIEDDYDIILTIKSFEVADMTNLGSLDMTIYENKKLPGGKE